MIFRSFLLGNLVSLYMKRVNLEGLYYGFLTTFSIGPFYLLLCRARIMEEREEEVEMKVSATTGFITGQLMMFIAIYYTPMHLALGRPYIITVLAPPYLLFHFLWNNTKKNLNSKYSNKNQNKYSIYNLNIQCIFMTFFFFKLLNLSFLPSSMLTRLVNIYMFRCNNKMVFISSNFIGWLMGHIFLMKGVAFFFICIGKNYYSQYKNYFIAKFFNFTTRLFSILFFIICIYYLDRIPSPILSKKVLECSKYKKNEEREKIKKITGIQNKNIREKKLLFVLKTRKDFKGVDKIQDILLKKKQKAKFGFHFQLIYYKNNRIYEIFYLKENQDITKLKKKLQNQEKNNFLWLEKAFITTIFNCKGWNRPLRYIKNERFENALRKEMSQYFFETCYSDGKLKISFTSLTSVVTFFKTIQKNLALVIYNIYLEKLSSNELYTYWININEQKTNNKINEVLKKIEIIYKNSVFHTIQIIRSCNLNNNKIKKYWPKLYDPFLKGPYRGTIKKLTLPLILKKKQSIQNLRESTCINKIHGILFTPYQELEQKKKIPAKKTLATTTSHFLTLISEFAKKSQYKFNLKKVALYPDHQKIDLTNQEKLLQFLFNTIITEPNTKKNFIFLKKFKEIKIIKKKVPQWSYKLIDELEQKEGENEEDVLTTNHEIRVRKTKRVIILFEKEKTNTNTSLESPKNSEETDEVSLIHYSHQSDFRRAIIKGSVRIQRRKIIIEKLFQTNIQSPLFFYSKNKKIIFFKFLKFLFFYFKNSIYIKEKLQLVYHKNKSKKREEKVRLAIAEAWDTIFFAQAIRGCMLITQSNLRKYIILPSLILTKNLGRLLLFKFPEWSEDFKEWQKEIHVKCTYHGVQLSENEFPQNWLTEGIQIKIIAPFQLKRFKLGLFHKHKIKTKRQKDSFFFLTVWGMKAKLPFDAPQSSPSFLRSIFSKLVIKLKKKFIQTLRAFKKNSKLIIKNSFLKKRTPLNSIPLFESTEPKYMNWTKYSLTERKKKNLKKKKELLTTEIRICPNKKSMNAKKRLVASKNIWQIFKTKRRNALLSQKSKYFFEKIYINTFSFIVNIASFNAQLFLTEVKKVSDTYILNDAKKKIETLKQTLINFSSIIKKLFYIYITSNISTKNSHIFFVMNLSYLSQRYLFLKISKKKISNLKSVRYSLQNPKIYFFFQNTIQNYCRIQGMLHSDYKLKRNKLVNFQLNQWKNWLRGRYPSEYKLSPIIWFRLIPKHWRIKINQNLIIQTKELNKKEVYKKKLYIYCKNKISSSYKGTSLSNKNKSFQKCHKYNIFSYKFYNFEKKNDFSIYGPALKKKKEGDYYNYNKHKYQLFTIFENIPINNYLRDNDIRNTDKKMNRKYFFFSILHIFIKKRKVDVKTWLIPHTNTKKNIKTVILNLQKFENKQLFYPILQKEITQSKKKKSVKKKRYKSNIEAELNLLLKKFFFFQLRWDELLSLKMVNNIKVYSFLLRLLNPKKICLSSIRVGELNLDLMPLQKNLAFKELIKQGIIIIEPIRLILLLKRARKPILYQTLKILLVHKNKSQINKVIPPKEKEDVDKIKTIKSISKYQMDIENKDKNHSNLLVPEKIFSRKQRREFRILIYFTSRKKKHVDINSLFCSGEKIKNFSMVATSKQLYKYKPQLKFFFLPSYRFEDLTCINRYWFDINNGGSFTMLKIHMYP